MSSLLILSDGRSLLILIGYVLSSVHLLFAQSLPVIHLNDENTHFEIGELVEVAEDPSHQLTFDQIRSANNAYRFTRSKQPTLNFGYSASDFWIRFKIKNTSAKNNSWLLETGNTLISHIELYTVFKDGLITHKKTGKKIPIEQRDIPEKKLMFAIDLPVQAEATLFLHVSGNDNKLFGIAVWEQQRFLSFSRQYDSILSFYFGILIALAVYNLFLFFSIFETSYLFYSLFIISMVLAQLSVTGFGFQYIIGGELLFNGHSIWFYSIFAIVFVILFSRRFLEIKSHFPILNKVLNTYIIVNLISFPILLYSIEKTYFLNLLYISSLFSVVVAGLLFIVSILIMRKGHRPARYFFIGWSVLLIASIITMLKHMSWVPTNWFTTYFMKIATTFEVLILSLGLADRFHTVTMKLKLKTLESEQLAESEKMKSDFFSNISHELRTPISLILSPLERILKNERPDPHIDQHKMMHRNAKRLLQLVNQLLYLTKLDNKAARLNVKEGDFVKQVSLIASYFESLAEEKNITFTRSFPVGESLVFPFDKEKTEIIVVNLLSNAFKFTAPGGHVALTLMRNTETPTLLKKQQKDSQFIKITISDSGIGIPAEQLDKIFDRFHQVNNSSSREYEGTGIGLSLVKELVSLHKGYLQVISTPGKGSEFIIYLPSDSSTYKVEDFIHDEALAAFPLPYPLPPDESALAHSSNHKSTEKNLVLIIEDNHDFRAFTKSILTDDYEVNEAVDGVTGLQLAKEKIPDIIITDMMMPKMDGIEVCRKLKEDISTSHIPVILLTARQSDEYKIKGLETGADDYLTKPFSADILLVRIRNLIEQRKRLRDKFSKEGLLHYQQETIVSVEDRFLLKMRETLARYHGHSDFTVESFADALNLSRTQLHRKLVALTNQSPGELLRHYRLEKAADLLKQKAGNVSEIAYQVGYENLSYFSKAFREKFGKSPSEI